MDPWRLDHRTAVVTGGTKGIGAACVAELADRGATVVFCARSHVDVSAAVIAHRGAGRQVRGVTADVATKEGRRALTEAVQGPVSAVVHNVGTNVRKPTELWSDEEFSAILATNTTPVFALTRAWAGQLIEAQGSVVVVSSVAAIRAVRTSSAAYAASKGALESMVRFLAATWGPRGVRVNAIAPWYVRTPLVDEVLSDPSKLASILDRTPLQRLGEPEDVARAVAFLATPASSWITGTVLAVDGGFSALGS